jgi:hypothetical protein
MGDNSFENCSDFSPVSEIKCKKKSVAYPICPRCKRENGTAIIYNNSFFEEKIILKTHAKITDCLKALWHASYIDTLPLELRNVKIPSILLMFKGFVLNKMLNIKDMILINLTFRLLKVMYWISKLLSKSGQR